MKLDEKKLNELQKLAGGLYYEVLDTKTIARVDTIQEGDFAWNNLRNNIINTVNEIKDIYIINTNRDYVNACENKQKDNIASIEDIVRGVLSEKEKNIFIYDWRACDYLDIKDEVICFSESQDFFMSNASEKEKKQIEKILEKINNLITIEYVNPKGYGYYDWDCYKIAYSNKTGKNRRCFIEDLKNYLDYIFTCEEYIVNIETIEKRKYENGEELGVIIENERISYFNYHGYDTRKDIELSILQDFNNVSEVLFEQL